MPHGGRAVDQPLPSVLPLKKRCYCPYIGNVRYNAMITCAGLCKKYCNSMYTFDTFFVAPPDLWLCRWHLPRRRTLCQPGATRLPSSAPTHVRVHCRTRVCLRVCVRTAGAGLKFWMLEERAGASVVLFPRSFGTGFCTRGYL